MIAVRRYRLNLEPGQTGKTVVHVSQFDTSAVKIVFELYSGTSVFAKPSGASAKVRMTKPDAKAIDNDVTYNSDGTVEFTLKEQMTAIPGVTRGKITILDSSGGQLGTAAFLMDVDPAGISDGAVVSESDLPELKQIYDKADAVEKKANEAAKSASAAAEHESAAKNSESNAKKSADAASNSQLATKQSEINASNFAASASTSMNAAEAAQKTASDAARMSSSAEGKAQQYKDAALEAARNASGYSGESEYRIGKDPGTKRPALYHYSAS